MKGISHFISGVAAASCFPWTVQAAAEGNPLYFVLGGIFGVLPDTMDFKFYRFFYHHDVYVEPDPLHMDPQAIAEQIADAVALSADEKREIRIKLSTIRMGADYWQQYRVKFDPEAREVRVQFGPVVNTGQVPVPQPGKEPQKVGVAKLKVPIVQTYEAVTTVDIFDGPTFGLEAGEKGDVIIHFLPWHRTWSHSLLGGLFLGALSGLAMGLYRGAEFGAATGLIEGLKVAVLVPSSFAAHVLEDQLGFMGSNLFWPITRKRFSGMHLMHAGDALPNFSVVWACCLLIFWNCYRQISMPLYNLTFLELLLYGAVLPMGAFALLHKLAMRYKKDDLCEEAKEIDNAGEWGESMAG